jgi:hypothetical protein
MWFRFLPPLLAIYLLLLSGLTRKWIEARIKDLTAQQQNLQPYRKVLLFVALSWSATLSFFGAMFSAFISVFSIYGSSRNYSWAVGTFVVLLAIFIPMVFYIVRFRADGLASTLVGPRIKMTAASFCRYVLLLVNVVLLGAIAASEYLPH